MTKGLLQAESKADLSVRDAGLDEIKTYQDSRGLEVKLDLELENLVTLKCFFSSALFVLFSFSYPCVLL